MCFSFQYHLVSRGTYFYAQLSTYAHALQCDLFISGRKEESSRSRKSMTVRESKTSRGGKDPRPSPDDASPVADDFRPEDVSVCVCVCLCVCVCVCGVE